MKEFFKNDWRFPILAAVAAGLYPIFFYCSNNFTLINSWQHAVFFTVVFLLFPIVVFLVADWIFGLAFLKKWHKYLLPFLNVFVFLFFLHLAVYAGIHKKITVLLFVVAVAVAFLLHKHLKKWMLVQFLLAIIGLVTLAPVVYEHSTVSKTWMQQPDDIAAAIFKKKPNIYYIQPDGYVNFSELDKGYYRFDNSAFEGFLKEEGFKNYPGFRNNYASTLSSNSANFMMKHHYYDGKVDFSKTFPARKSIMTDNAVVKILRNNGYKTHYLSTGSYLLLNRPKVVFDATNIPVETVPFIGSGFENPSLILPPLKEFMAINPDRPKFFFIEFFLPSHIATTAANTKGKEKERLVWLENLKEANLLLEKIIAEIKKRDPNPLIVIMSDHGGSVGLEHTGETYTKTQDRNLIYSIFSSVLAIHWPNNDSPNVDKNLKTAVNMFRVLISYLTEKPEYLQHLQADESYMMIKDGAPKGIYKYIDEDGNITFKKH